MHSWGTGDSMQHLRPIYAKAFDLFRGDIEDSLAPYISRYGVDMNNPSDGDMYMLVNEIFSKQGTSILDFADNKASTPAGFSSKNLNEMKRLASKGIDEFYLSMEDVAGISIKDKEAVRAFAKQLLQMQTAGVMNRRVSFNYEVGTGHNTRTMTIRNTPFGQTKSFTSHNESASRLTARRERLENMNDGKFKDFVRFISQNSLFGGGISGREVQRIITGGSAIGTHHDNQVLRDKKALAAKIEAIYDEVGVDSRTRANPSFTTLRLMKKYGVKRKSWLALAKEHDAMSKELKVAKLEENENLMATVRDQISWVQEMQDLERVSPSQAGLIISELQGFARKMRLDWEHVRYTAYDDPSDQNTLRDMWRYLKQRDGAIDLEKQHDDAHKAQIALSNKRKSMSLKDRNAYQKLEELKMPHVRLKNLKEMFRLKRAAGRHNPIQDDTELMINYISKIINGNNKYRGLGGGSQTMNTVKSVRHRRLDHDAGMHTSDWHEIQFLNKINDSVQTGIHNIHQLKEVQRIMHDNFKLAKQLIANDQASLGVAEDNIDLSFGAGQDGTVMKFLAVKPEIASDIREQLDIQKSVTRNMFTDFVSHVKIMQTVGSAFGHASNAVNALSLLAFNGDLTHPIKLLTALPSASKQSWLSKMHGKDTKGSSPYVREIISEMQEMAVLGTGLSTLTLEVTNQTGVAQSVTESMTKLGTKLGMSKVTKISLDDRVRAASDTLKEMYAFSDDVPKIMRYMINKELTTKKWGAKLKRADFGSDKEHQQAINTFAKQEAGDLTLRQNTDFSAIPLHLKKIAYNNGRVVFGNFISHSAMLVKIHSENARIWGEMRKDLSEAKSMNTPEGKAWKRAIQRTMVDKALGNGLVYSGIGMGLASGASLFGSMTNAVLGTFVDEEHLPSEDQMLGSSMMMQHLPYYKQGINYNPITYKEGNRIYALDAMRMDYHGALAVVPDASTEPNRIDQILRLPSSLFLAGDQGNIVEQVSDAIRGVDWKGSKLNDKRQYFENMGTVMANLGLPAGVREVTQVATSRSWYSGKRAPNSEFLARFAGVRVKSFDSRQMITDIGNQLGRELMSAPVISQMLAEASLGKERLDAKSTVSLVKRDLEHAKKMDNEYRHFVQGAQKFGFSKSKIIKHLTSRADSKDTKTFMKKSDAELLVHRGRVFAQSSLKKIDSKLKRVQKHKVSVTFTQRDKERALHNLRSLRTHYKYYILR